MDSSLSSSLSSLSLPSLSSSIIIMVVNALEINFQSSMLSFFSSSSTSREINIGNKSPSWIHDLNDKGYAVVPNVLSSQQCDHIIDKTWEWLEALGTGIQRGDSTTWTTTAGHKIITASFKVTGLATRLSCGKRGQTRTSQVCSRKSGALRNC